MSDPSLPQQLADLAGRARAWAQARAVADPSVRVRLARPLEGVPIPTAVAEILAAPSSAGDAARPSPPWAASLEAFQRQIQACQRCPLGGRRKRFVFGEGNSDARLVFVGDAPGADEDASGRPFMGAAGELLDRMIAAMGFKRAEVYLVNVLKCRPLPGRGPDAAEVEACSPYLEQQLALLRPKVIVGLGAGAVQQLSGQAAPLAQLRGRWAEHKGVPLMPTYHPSDLLKDPGLKRHVWDDLKLVMKRLNA